MRSPDTHATDTHATDRQATDRHITSLPVLLFASYADAFGARILNVPIVAPCRARDLVDVMRRLPGGERLPPEPLVAVNQSWSPLDRIVEPGDEVALIPPVAGG
jgi:molybdopterin converting factor small subunit